MIGIDNNHVIDQAINYLQLNFNSFDTKRLTLKQWLYTCSIAFADISNANAELLKQRNEL